MTQPPTTGPPASGATCWTLIRDAAGGDGRARDEFARRYLPMVRRSLRARWRRSPLLQEVDDAAQEVFLACVRDDGLLAHADPERGASFRAYLLGAIRNVARRFEQRRGAARATTSVLASLEAQDEDMASLLDREWARCIMVQAAEQHRRTALARGATARRRVELLRLRFEEGLPIRAIAARWDADPASLHEAYRLARREFQDALRKVVAFHRSAREDLDTECRRLLELL